jgi:hypothetical protein
LQRSLKIWAYEWSMGIAGGEIVIQAFYGDDAKLAGADGLEVWVGRKVLIHKSPHCGRPDHLSSTEFPHLN